MSRFPIECAVVRWASNLLVIAALGCAPESDVCLPVVDLDCAVAYPPTYTNIFQQTLRGTCGGPGVSCHGSNGRQAGLAFVSESESYQQLLQPVIGSPRVIAGDPEGSTLLQRVECSSPLPRMPLNSDPLPATARCAIQRWIADGAEP